MRILKRLVRSILPARVHGALRRVAHTRRLNRGAGDDSGRRPASQGGGDFIPGVAPGAAARPTAGKKAKTSIDEIFEDTPGSHAIDPESRGQSTT